MHIVDTKSSEINIYAVSDLHLDHKNSLVDAFKYVIDTVKNDPKGKLILVGDMLDMSVRSSVRDESERAMTISDAIYRLAELLRPVANKISLVVTGNHEDKTAKRYLDWSIETTVLNMIGVNPGFVFRSEETIDKIGLVVFRLQDADTKRFYKVFATHGTRGGSIGNVVNKLIQANQIEGLDLKIVGHFHEFGLSTQGLLYIDRYGNLRTKVQTAVALSSFLPSDSFMWRRGRNISIPVMAKFNVKFDRTRKEVYTTPQIETLERFIKTI